MSFSITYTYPSPIVKDFLTFLEYCEQQQPKLTRNTQYLSRRALWDINELLKNPARDVSPRNNQPLFLPIHFFYHIALAARFFRIDRSKSNPCFIPDSDHLDYFRTLSIQEQYLFIVKTYWIFCNWEEMAAEKTGNFLYQEIDELVEIIAQANEGEEYHGRVEILRKINHRLGTSHSRYWELLGWLKLNIWKEKHFAKQTYLYDSVVITPFGKWLAERFVEQETTLISWNEHSGYYPSLDVEMDIEEMEMDMEEFMELFGPDGDAEEENSLFSFDFTIPATREEWEERIAILEQRASEQLGIDLNLKAFMLEHIGRPIELADVIAYVMDKLQSSPIVQEILDEEDDEFMFERVFDPLFPEDNANELEIRPYKEPVEGRLVFKIYPKYMPNVWRQIEMDAGNTLDMLHLMIQKAFNFDNDHLYSFYLSGKLGTGVAFHDVKSGKMPFTVGIVLGNLELYEGQHILYHFDYGDNWEFIIEVTTIKEGDTFLAEPQITRIVGQAPEQYEYFEEDEWD